MAALPQKMEALYASSSDPTTAGAGPLQLAHTTRPLPSVPDNAALVRVLAAGINPSDFANAILNRFGGSKPIIPGRDFAGIVVQCASEPSLVGIDVYGTSGRELSLTGDGSHAEYIAVPIVGLVSKPKTLSWSQAGAAGVPYSTASLLLNRVGFRPASDVVLVLGATGAVGSAVVDIVKAKGSKTITASRHESTDVNITTSAQLTKVLELNGGKGPDVIIDCAGSPDLMEKGLAILGKGGRYGFISGMRGGGPEVKINVMKMFAMDQSLLGINSFSPSLAEAAKLLGALGELFEDGAIKGIPEENITKVGIEAAAAAYQEVAKMEGKKFVLVFD